MNPAAIPSTAAPASAAGAVSASPASAGADTDAHSAALRSLARQRVGRKIGLAIHALAFVLVHLGLAARHLWADNDLGTRPWPLLWGWALGLSIHALVTALSLLRTGPTLHARWVARELAALQRRG